MPSVIRISDILALLDRESYTSRKAALRARVIEVGGIRYLEVDRFSEESGSAQGSVRYEVTGAVMQAMMDTIDAERVVLLARKSDLNTLKTDLQAL